VDVDLFKKWFPFFSTIQTYNKQKFRLDVTAGLTVALVALPQSMAYALIAGVEPKYGIYAVIVGSIIGALFGSSRHLHTGPVNASSLVIAATLFPFVHNDNYMAMVFLLAFLSGVFQLVAGIFKLGNITQFISRSVLVGFMAGAALLIIINQIPNLVGIDKFPDGAITTKVSALIQNIGDAELMTFIIGLAAVLLVLMLNRLSPKTSSGVPYIPSYLLALIISSVVVALLGLTDKSITAVGAMPASLPPLSAPAFDLKTADMLASGALALTIISISEAIASAKSTASLAGDKIQPNQELIGPGLAKIGVSFFSGIPVSGSFTRTALNFQAGAQTRFAAVFS
jgi:SulP family sulfate permease